MIDGVTDSQHQRVDTRLSDSNSATFFIPDQGAGNDDNAVGIWPEEDKSYDDSYEPDFYHDDDEDIFSINEQQRHIDSLLQTELDQQIDELLQQPMKQLQLEIEQEMERAWLELDVHDGNVEGYDYDEEYADDEVSLPWNDSTVGYIPNECPGVVGSSSSEGPFIAQHQLRRAMSSGALASYDSIKATIQLAIHNYHYLEQGRLRSVRAGMGCRFSE